MLISFQCQSHCQFFSFKFFRSSCSNNGQSITESCFRFGWPWSWQRYSVCQNCRGEWPYCVLLFHSYDKICEMVALIIFFNAAFWIHSSFSGRLAQRRKGNSWFSLWGTNWEPHSERHNCSSGNHLQLISQGIIPRNIVFPTVNKTKQTLSLNSITMNRQWKTVERTNFWLMDFQGTKTTLTVGKERWETKFCCSLCCFLTVLKKYN